MVEVANADALRPVLGLARSEALGTIEARRDEPLPLFFAANECEAGMVREVSEPIDRPDARNCGQHGVGRRAARLSVRLCLKATITVVCTGERPRKGSAPRRARGASFRTTPPIRCSRQITDQIDMRGAHVRRQTFLGKVKPQQLALVSPQLQLLAAENSPQR